MQYKVTVSHLNEANTSSISSPVACLKADLCTIGRPTKSDFSCVFGVCGLNKTLASENLIR